MAPLGYDSLKRPELEPYQREDGKWDWRLIAGNGEQVCSSNPQGFDSKGDAERGAQRAVELMANAVLVLE
jgi:uncharacterized protein YegP (UPF0339 family)